MAKRGSHQVSANAAKQAAQFTIGQAAKLSGVSAKMLRHYEALRLIPILEDLGASPHTQTAERTS